MLTMTPYENRNQIEYFCTSCFKHHKGIGSFLGLKPNRYKECTPRFICPPCSKKVARIKQGATPRKPEGTRQYRPGFVSYLSHT